MPPPLHLVVTWDGRMRHNVLGPPPSYPFQSEVKTNCHHLPPGLDTERPQPQVVGPGEVRTIGML
jgi:hypothetical protein